MNIPIPEVRKEMQIIAGTLRRQAATILANAEALERLANGAVRRSAGKPKAPATAVKMTPALKKVIRQFTLENPKLSVAKIGEIFGVNPGRVSEALNDLPGRVKDLVE